ncbi:MAG TPA: hypothetical protein VKZ50_08730 [bacterium]|nr:hypothetical protein [bacterium]
MTALRVVMLIAGMVFVGAGAVAADEQPLWVVPISSRPVKVRTVLFENQVVLGEGHVARLASGRSP